MSIKCLKNQITWELPSELSLDHIPINLRVEILQVSLWSFGLFLDDTFLFKY